MIGYLGRLAPALVMAYLLGSVSSAIIVTRLRSGRDIRELGNLNAGANNVAHVLGKRWGALVFFLDASKSALPMLAARVLLFPGDSDAELLALLGIGAAAVLGHCRPIYYGFRGGRGVATSMPVYFALVPIEFLASTLLAALLVAAFVRTVPYRLGRYVPMLFITVAPFLTLGVNAVLDVRLCPWLSIGGHPGSVVAGIFALSLFLLLLDRELVLDAIRRLRRTERS